MEAASVVPVVAVPRSQDPSHDIFRGDRHSLDVFFRPKNVAVVGATETAGTVGRTLLWNLIQNSFGGAVYPVNPKRKSVLGIKAYPKISDLPEPVDLAVVATPAPTVPDVIAECAQAGARGAIVISAGFKETGPEGAALEKRLADAARGKMRILGPNCLGLMCPPTGVNATFAGAMARPGHVGFISQSGALCTAVLDWSLRENVGFSIFASVGSMMDVGWGDLIDFLGHDPETESIVIYMETVGDARRFLSAAREVALTKPIIVIKAGRTEQAAKAAVSHTGSLAGSDAVLDAAFDRCGVLRVESIAHLFQMAATLDKQPLPKGPRLTVVTNAGGPGVLATDALITHGGTLSELSPTTIENLNKILPGPWSHGNPVDVLGDAGAERYAKTLEITEKDPNADGLLVILTPQAMTEPTATAKLVAEAAKKLRKPVLASWMGGDSVEEGRRILSEAKIPVFDYPDTAAKIFSYMWNYSGNLRALYETPHSLPENEGVRAQADAAALIAAVRRENRVLLTEFESKNLLAAYGIPTVETRMAFSAKEAAAAADALGYPVVLKLHSAVITHKSDVGGVKLNLDGREAVQKAFDDIQKAVQGAPGAFGGVTVQKMVRRAGVELILGASPDPQFGPVLLFGAGGTYVEIFKDSALGLPPLTDTLARRMIGKTKIAKALAGVRGQKPADMPALENVMVRFSQLVAEQPWIKEIDINPLLASAEGVIALDARVALHPAGGDPRTLPRPAIRPYPAAYAKPFQMKNGKAVMIRPIRPEDEPAVAAFHSLLSERSVLFRFKTPFELQARTTHERLRRVCFTDYDREIVLVVERPGPEPGRHEILAMGRLSKVPGAPRATFAILVADPFQNLGLGTELIKRLLDIARAEGLAHVSADIHADNAEMKKTAERLGFRLTVGKDGAVRAEISISD